MVTAENVRSALSLFRVRKLNNFQRNGSGGDESLADVHKFVDESERRGFLVEDAEQIRCYLLAPGCMKARALQKSSPKLCRVQGRELRGCKNERRTWRSSRRQCMSSDGFPTG